MFQDTDSRVKEVLLDWLETSDNKDTAPLRHGIREMIRGLEAENVNLRREVSQLRQRTSPATEPCGCPEFCTYHARSNFESMRLQINEMRVALEIAKPSTVHVVSGHVYGLDGKLEELVDGCARCRIERVLISAERVWCGECGGSGEIGLADGDVHCPTCKPEYYKRACAHDWKDARNEVVKNGEVCIKCGAIRAENRS